ncbi:replication factor A protein 3-domain-containing protein [Annulohypoxylon bovei var. microspora]|nr:replication factor A protein 3-domain-containing protein [Annulohypoxylon bovei var. microspora]
MESTSTPRISAALMDSHVGQNVIIVGKVVQLRGDTAFLEADGQVQANLNRDCHLMVGNGAQIIGKVNPDLSLKVLNAIDLGNNVDFQLCQNVVDVTHQFKDVFQQQQQQSSSQQSQPQPLFIAQPRSQQNQKLPTVAEPANNTAFAVSPVSTASARSSQSSLVITPPTNELSQLSIQERPRSSSQFTTQQSNVYSTLPTQYSTQNAQNTQNTQYTEYTEYTEEEATSHQRRRRKSSSPPRPQLTPERWTSPSPSNKTSSQRPSTPPRALPESPIAEPSFRLSRPFSLPFSIPWTAPRPRGRLYRTRSGNLVSSAEMRRRRETEKHADELLDMIIEDFGDEASRIITFTLDEEGRWRIVRRELVEVEVYEDR